MFLAGLEVGALATALAIWLLGGLLSPLPDTVGLAVVVGFAVFALLRDTGRVRFALPEPRRLVPQSIFEQGRTSAAFRFGVELGSGVRTYLPSSLPYLVALVLLIEGGGANAVLAATGFALGRFGIVLVRFVSARGIPTLVIRNSSRDLALVGCLLVVSATL